ncbi:hypothetical protein NDS46_14175 [Paenibacillus thiaminolyticus]|uniref:hypothetical protein n=1 Tax=Paenibacillus thiaminolyticus TaxID=49283 RepID=UPI00232BCFE4|nr:hypothetical protein [Paenibacillus thiaminolyticus]WCF10916.1 hypothetical protein NDS46_14175 [Paenibacillus thiaminolyticus]
MEAESLPSPHPIYWNFFSVAMKLRNDIRKLADLLPRQHLIAYGVCSCYTLTRSRRAPPYLLYMRGGPSALLRNDIRRVIMPSGQYFSEKLSKPDVFLPVAGTFSQAF